MAKVGIAAVGYKAGPIGGFQEFATKCGALVGEAGAHDPDLVVFPELLTGELMTFMGGKDMSETYRRIAGYTEEYRDLFSGLARRHGFTIVAGSHITEDAGALYNTAYIFTPEGEVWEQRKMHLAPGEKRFFSPGNSLAVFQTGQANICILTCYDVEFPEAARLATLRGAEIIISPSASLDEQGYWRVRHSAQARCIENQVYAVNSTLVGGWGHPRLRFWGKPSILCPCDKGFPPGGIMAEGPANEEAVIYAELETEMLGEIRAGGSVLPLEDMREDLCASLHEELRRYRGL